MIEIHLSAGEIRQAKQVQEEMDRVKVGLDSRVTSQKNKDAIGASGEIAVKKYLDYTEVEYEICDVAIKRHYKDNFDFKIGSKKIDVKTSKKWRGIVLSGKQKYITEKKGIHLLVGVHYVREDLCYILGYAFPKDLERDEEKDFEHNGEKRDMYSIPDDKIIPLKQDGLIL